MKFFLRYINPILALLVFAFCLWAATSEKGDFTPLGFLAGSFGSYFFAKGIFASTSIYLMGEILFRIIVSQEHAGVTTSIHYTNRYISFLVGASMSIFLLFVAMVDKDILFPKDKPRIVHNPQIEIVKSYRITESEDLRLGGIIRNKTQIKWDTLKIEADVSTSGKYIGTCHSQIKSVVPNGKENFVIECRDYKNKNVGESLSFKIKITDGLPE